MSAEAAQAAVPQIVSTDDAVELIWARVLSGEFSNVASSARDLWPTLRFSPDDRDFLSLIGLIHLARREQGHTQRDAVPRPAIGVGAPHGKQWDKYIALSWPFKAADGVTKSLFDFTADDLAVFATDSLKLAETYRRRATWASETQLLLAEYSKSRVRDLPAAVLAEVDVAAREAMGRQS